MCVAQFGGGLKTFGFVTGMNFLLLWILIPSSVIMGREAASQKTAKRGIPKISIAKLSLSTPNWKDDLGSFWKRMRLVHRSQKRGQDLPKLPAASPGRTAARHQIPGDLPQMLVGTAQPVGNLAGQQPPRGFSSLFLLFSMAPHTLSVESLGRMLF